MIIFWKASLPIALCPDPDFAAASFVRDAVYVYHPATAKLSKEWPQCSFLLPLQTIGQDCLWRWAREVPILSYYGCHAHGSVLLLERFIVRAERWRHYPLSSCGPRSPGLHHRPPPAHLSSGRSTPAAAHRHMWSLSLVLSTASVWILPPHLSPWCDRGCQYGISNENSIYSY